MKNILCLVLLFVLSAASYGQKKKDDKFDAIDKFAGSTDFYPVRELARKLTAPYKDESSKVRSVFMWIATHIDYDVVEYRTPFRHDYARFRKPIDSLHISPSDYHDYELALETLERKMSVCAGYASLFKVLCIEACIEAAVISGVGRHATDIGTTTMSNHDWNKVRIDGKWELLDVTWASGNVPAGDMFYIRAFNENYYRVPPERMILNHFPDLPANTLLDKPASKLWFDQNAYLYMDSKPGLIPSRYAPARGMLGLRRGDTVNFEFDVTGQVWQIGVDNGQQGGLSTYQDDPANKLRNESKERRRVASPVQKPETIQAKKRNGSGPKVRSTAKTPPVKRGKHEMPTEMMPAGAGEEGQGPKILEWGAWKPVPSAYTFSDDGKTVRFRYIATRGGTYMLNIFVNGQGTLSYKVYAR